MRILYLSHGYPPTVSGVTLVVQKLARAMVANGNAVRVVTASETGKAYSVDDQGVEVQRVRSLKNPFWSEGPPPVITRSRLREIISEFQPDIIHTHENVFLSTSLRLMPRDSVPRVSSCYFLPRYLTHYIHLGPANHLLQAATWKYIINNLHAYDHVIFSTRSQEKDFIDHGLKTPSMVISNGVDTLRYRPLDGLVEDLTGRYHLPAGVKILFVGRLMPDKKIHLLVEALAHLPPEPPAHLLVIGRGSERQRLENLARQLGVGQQVHFLGFVPEADLPAIYRACDIFAIASICEVQSIPTLQAVVTGLPVVAVDAAALPELVKPGINGWLTPPDDPQLLGQALAKLISSPEQRRRFGQASLAIGAPHAEQATFQAYADFYEALP